MRPAPSPRSIILTICQLYDIGPDYPVMEYVDGRPLRGPLPAPETVRLNKQLGLSVPGKLTIA